MLPDKVYLLLVSGLVFAAAEMNMFALFGDYYAVLNSSPVRYLGQYLVGALADKFCHLLSLLYL